MSSDNDRLNEESVDLIKEVDTLRQENKTILEENNNLKDLITRTTQKNCEMYKENDILKLLLSQKSQETEQYYRASIESSSGHPSPGSSLDMLSVSLEILWS